MNRACNEQRPAPRHHRARARAHHAMGFPSSIIFVNVIPTLVGIIRPPDRTPCTSNLCFILSIDDVKGALQGLAADDERSPWKRQMQPVIQPAVAAQNCRGIDTHLPGTTDGAIIATAARQVNKQRLPCEKPHF